MYLVVAGGGMVGGLLVRSLLENKHDVVLVDPDKDVCNKLYADTGVIAVNGSATRIEVLKEAGLAKADAVVITTPDDAENLACAILAKSLAVPQIIVRMRDPNYENAYKVIGVNAIVRVTDLMVNRMLIEIEHPKVRRITSIGGGKANIFMVLVPENAKVVGKKIEEIAKSRDFPSECIFIAVYNQQKEDFSIPRGSQVINEGDELFLISTATDIKKVADYLTAKDTIKTPQLT
jgi:trk system potassium uptake protein TrkA